MLCTRLKGQVQPISAAGGPETLSTSGKTVFCRLSGSSAMLLSWAFSPAYSCLPWEAGCLCQECLSHIVFLRRKLETFKPEGPRIMSVGDAVAWGLGELGN